MWVIVTVLSCWGQSMLRYRTNLLKLLETLLFLPAFLSGAAEQKQVLDVELFSDYTDDPVSPELNCTALNVLTCVCVWIASHFLKVCLSIIFISCTVCSLSHCCRWDPVQQGADLLIAAPHSCSVHWYKVGVMVRFLLKLMVWILRSPLM